MKQVLRLVFLLAPLALSAQMQTIMPFMQRLHQSTYYNPAILPEYSTSFNVPAFPGLGLGVSMHGLNARMVLDHVDADGLVDLPAVYNEIKEDKIELNTDLNLELFHVRFKSRQWYYGISLNHRTIASVSVARDLIGFAINGNDHFAGRTADFSTTRVDAMAFSELGFSMARNYKRWNFGGRAKLLHGNAAATTSNSTLSFYTPEHTTGEIIVKLNGSLRTSGVPLFTDSINGTAASDADKETGSGDFTSFKNLGGALDLGITYDVTSRFTVGASVTDLGYITWKNKTFNYNQEDVEVRFGGIDYEALNNDSVYQNYEDSMVNLFDGSITRDQFTTMLPARFIFNASYELSKRNIIGGMIQGRYFNRALRMAYTANYLHKFRNIDVALNYSVIGRHYANIGLGFAAKMGVFQVYVVQDNVLGYFMMDRLGVVNLRFGLNFVWGEIRKPLKVY